MERSRNSTYPACKRTPESTQYLYTRQTSRDRNGLPQVTSYYQASKSDRSLFRSPYQLVSYLSSRRYATVYNTTGPRLYPQSCTLLLIGREQGSLEDTTGDQSPRRRDFYPAQFPYHYPGLPAHLKSNRSGARTWYYSR